MESTGTFSYPGNATGGSAVWALIWQFDIEWVPAFPGDEPIPFVSYPVIYTEYQSSYVYAGGLAPVPNPPVDPGTWVFRSMVNNVFMPIEIIATATTTVSPVTISYPLTVQEPYPGYVGLSFALENGKYMAHFAPEDGVSEVYQLDPLHPSAQGRGSIDVTRGCCILSVNGVSVP